MLTLYHFPTLGLSPLPCHSLPLSLTCLSSRFLTVSPSSLIASLSRPLLSLFLPQNASPTPSTPSHCLSTRPSLPLLENSPLSFILPPHRCSLASYFSSSVFFSLFHSLFSISLQHSQSVTIFFTPPQHTPDSPPHSLQQQLHRLSSESPATKTRCNSY